MSNRPIDRVRDSGGYTEIGSEEDGTIIELIAVGERAFVVKTGAIYEQLFADDIDPERTNIGLPNYLQTLVVKQGADSELVGKIFLTAKTLFKPEYIIDSVDTVRVVGLSLLLLQEAVALEQEIKDYLELERAENSAYEEREGQKHSYSIPVVTGLETRCKTIFQRTDHIDQILVEIVCLFYPDGRRNSRWRFEHLNKVIKKHGTGDHFVLFVKEASPFMKVLKELRNSLDHRLSQFVTVTNYDVQPSSEVISPTIELKPKDGASLPRVSLFHYLPLVQKRLIGIVETTFVYLAEKNKKGHLIGSEVREIPESRRRNKFVRYSFWGPLGDGGYYSQ